MTGVSIIRAGTAHERKESKANTIRVLGKQHDFRTVLPTLGLNQPPSDLLNKEIRQKLGKAVARFCAVLTNKVAFLLPY